jgi:hypothetical protein
MGQGIWFACVLAYHGTQSIGGEEDVMDLLFEANTQIPAVEIYTFLISLHLVLSWRALGCGKDDEQT